jgi:hypothetical protein
MKTYKITDNGFLITKQGDLSHSVRWCNDKHGRATIKDLEAAGYVEVKPASFPPFGKRHAKN